MIFPNSRYVNSPVVLVDTPQVFTDENGPSVQALYWSQPADYTFKYKYYLWKSTDRPDTLAYTNYGDATLWWFIANANPEILNWSDLSVGTVIRIPNS
jgi:hypothetical protein